MSRLEAAVITLVDIFHKHSGKEGDKTTLSKGELKELLTAELANVLKKTIDQAALDNIFKNMDADKDNKVDFQEYVTFIAQIIMLCNEFFPKK